MAASSVARKLPPSDTIAIVACAALAVIGAFLPWASVGFVSVSGIHGDGVLSLIAGVLGLAALLASGKRRVFYILEFLLACFVVFVGGYHAGNEMASTGVYLTLIAGLVWVIVAFLGVVRRR